MSSDPDTTDVTIFLEKTGPIKKTKYIFNQKYPSKCNCVYCNSICTGFTHSEWQHYILNYNELNYNGNCIINQCKYCGDNIKKVKEPQWYFLDEFIVFTHGLKYFNSLYKRINEYIQAIFDDAPFIKLSEFFKNDIDNGCHISRYIDDIIKYNNSEQIDFITTIIVKNSLSIMTIQRIYEDFIHFGYMQNTIIIECIKTQKMRYLREYNNNFKINIRKNNITKFIKNNTTLFTHDLFIELIDIFGKDIIDNEIIICISKCILLIIDYEYNNYRKRYDPLQMYSFAQTHLHQSLDTIKFSSGTEISELDKLPKQIKRLSTNLTFYNDIKSTVNLIPSDIEQISIILELCKSNEVYKLCSRYFKEFIHNPEILRNIIDRLYNYYSSCDMSFSEIEETTYLLDLYEKANNTFTMLIENIFTSS